MGLDSSVDKDDLARFLITESKRYNFDPFFIVSVIFAESHLDNYAVSRVGALGLMQIMPETGRRLVTGLGYKWQGINQLFDPYLNIHLGIYYLYKLRQEFKNPHHFLAAYNEGPARIRRKRQRGQRIPSEYTTTILAYYNYFAKSPDTRQLIEPTLH